MDQNARKQLYKMARNDYYACEDVDACAQLLTLGISVALTIVLIVFGVKLNIDPDFIFLCFLFSCLFYFGLYFDIKEKFLKASKEKGKICGTEAERYWRKFCFDGKDYYLKQLWIGSFRIEYSKTVENEDLSDGVICPQDFESLDSVDLDNLADYYCWIDETTKLTLTAKEWHALKQLLKNRIVYLALTETEYEKISQSENPTVQMINISGLVYN